MVQNPKDKHEDRPTTAEIRTKILMMKRMIVMLMKTTQAMKKKKIRPSCRNWEASYSLDAEVVVNDELYNL